MEIKDLDFTGCESCTSEPAYDIMNGYYDSEIKCKKTLKKIKEAIKVLGLLEDYLDENELTC